jgi:calcium-dependent protein kinase
VGRFKVKCKDKNRFGSVFFIAPEVIKKESDFPCDVWSCGVIMYILLCGRLPFEGATPEDVARKVHKGDFKMVGPEWDVVSSESKELLTQMLEKNSIYRITAIDAMNHDWILNMTRKIKEDKLIHDSVYKGLRDFNVSINSKFS